MNKKLLNLAEKSALKQSSLPIMICSRDYKIRMKSVGGEYYMAGLATGKDIHTMFSPELLRSLQAAEDYRVHRGIMVIHDRDYPIMVSCGKVQEEPYLAILFENGVPLTDFRIPGRNFEEAFRRLCQDTMNELHQLLTIPFRKDGGSNENQKLLQCNERLVRTKRLAAMAARELSHSSTGRLDMGSDGITNVLTALAALQFQASAMLPAIGCQLRILLPPPEDDGILLDANCESFLLLAITGSLTLLNLSSKHSAKLACRVIPGAFPMLELTITAASDPSIHADIPAECNLKELAARIPFFSIELLICHALADILNWSCVFRNQADTLSLTCTLPMSRRKIALLHSPEADIEIDEAGQLFAMLLANLRTD